MQGLNDTLARMDDLKLRIIEAHWSVVVIAPMPGCPSSHLTRAISSVLLREQRHAVVFDFTDLPALPNSIERKAIADWMKAHLADLKLYTVAQIYVTNASMARAVITGLGWVSPIPTRVCDSRIEAIMTARSLVQGA